MYPAFQIGTVTLYSYGLMLTTAFSVAAYFFMGEIKRKGLPPDLGIKLTLISVVGGLVGARLLSLLENRDAFLRDPLGAALSSGGFTFYGGLLLVIATGYLYLRKRRIRFLPVMDCVVPSLLIAYGIARIGCHLAGDGDYGYPTTLPWGTDYSQGIYPPSLAFRNIPEIAGQYPGGVVPDHTPCDPVPIYEFLICAGLFWVFWRARTHISPDGKLLMLYLVAAGIERFFIEFLRISPRIAFGLTGAQIISVVLVSAGLLGLHILGKSSLQDNSPSSRPAL